MRVALMPSAYAPAVGGVEELTRRLADRLKGIGDTVEVWTFRHPPGLPMDEVIEGIRVRRFAFPLPARRAGTLRGIGSAAHRTVAALSKAVADFRPDLLHVQCFSANGVYATELARRRRLPLVVTLQGETVMDDTDIYERSVVLRWGLRRALRRADAVTGCSRFVLADARERFGLPADRGQVIHNGVEVAGDQVAAPLEMPFARFVLALGRVVPKKGFDLLLDAFAAVAAKHDDVGLLIGGSGPGLAPLRHRAHELGLGDRVALPGRLTRGQVAWAMRQAAAFVLPSRVEPFGIVVLEALRAGCPVVVSGRGGAPEIVRDGREGLVVDPHEPEQVALALNHLLADPALAARLAGAGRQRVERFGWDRIAAQYRQLYEAVR